MIEHVCIVQPQPAVPSFPLRYFQRPEADFSSSDFWELAHKLGYSVQQYTYNLLRDAAISNPAAAGRLRDFQDTMAHVVSSTTRLRDEVQRGAEARGLTLEHVSEILSAEMAALLEELKAEFPAPDEADHHEHRAEMVSRALLRMEASVVRVSMHCGVSESDARAHFQNIEPHVLRVIVVVGECLLFY
jgi:hypothetical protein